MIHFFFLNRFATHNIELLLARIEIALWAMVSLILAFFAKERYDASAQSGEGETQAEGQSPPSPGVFDR